jgi:hypothetical protein
MTHLTWEQLNDYADDVMAPGARSSASNHLDSCAACRDTLVQLRSLLASAKAAPASIEPPAGAWTGIRETIDARKISALPQLQIPRDKPWSRMSWLVAAAILLIVASSGTTLMVVRRGASHVPGVTLTPNGGPLGVAGRLNTLPASFVTEERGYLNTVSELTAALNKSRSSLAPETIRTVEHSLKVIDDAIAEARAALARDPSNPLLRDFLTKHYEQKVDFLRRVSGRTS